MPNVSRKRSRHLKKLKQQNITRHWWKKHNIGDVVEVELSTPAYYRDDESMIHNIGDTIKVEPSTSANHWNDHGIADRRQSSVLESEPAIQEIAMEDLPWGMEKQVHFIRLYKQYQRLWNPKDHYFKNKQAKISAWSSMSSILETDALALQKRMKNMMSQFSREKSRLKSAFRLDPEAALPEPRWYLFKEMDFLLEKFEPRLTAKLKEGGIGIKLEDEVSVHFSEGENSECSGDVVIATPDSQYLQTSPVPPHLTVTPNERKWQLDPLSDEQQTIPFEENIVPPKRVCKTDRNRAFVEYVYEVLKDLEMGRAADLRHSIHELLHTAELEQSFSSGPPYIKEDLS